MKITDSKSLGQAIRARRKELNYTQAYVSEFTGFSVTFISDLERGKPTAELENGLLCVFVIFPWMLCITYDIKKLSP